MPPNWGPFKGGASKPRTHSSQSPQSEHQKREPPEQASEHRSKEPSKGPAGGKPEEFSEESSEDSPEPSKGVSKSVEKKHGNAQSRTFIVIVWNLRPLYGNQAPKANKHGNWDPPESKDQFEKSGRTGFRWCNGNITTLSGDDAIFGRPFTQHNVASVFPQAPGGQLLVIDVDVTRQNVSESKCGHWRALTFRHEKKSNSKNSYYSYLDFGAANESTAAPITNHCVTQLLPHIHNSRNLKRENAGLIGKLPLLFAVAALSGPSTSRNAVMRACIRPGKWAGHMQQACGRDEKWHGVVVAIYYDSNNLAGSTPQTLDSIESGSFGPFYGPGMNSHS